MRIILPAVVIAVLVASGPVADPRLGARPRRGPRQSRRSVAVLALMGLIPAAVSPAQSSGAVVILGTGTPNPDPERSGPAVAVVANGSAYLVDAGPGVVRRAAAAASRHAIPGLEAARLDIVFLTHLHSDHTVGLPDLIHTPWVLERGGPLRVFGPPGTAAMAEHLTAAWAADIENRTSNLQPHRPNGWRIQAVDIAAPGMVYQDSNVVVRAFAVPHDGWAVSYGYRFEVGGRVLVISGDTRASDAVVDACNGCEVLVHEVYDAERFPARPPEWQRYHADAHTSTVELAALAARARPRLLVLYHQLFWGGSDDDLVRQVRDAGYPGRTVSARDLDLFPERP